MVIFSVFQLQQALLTLRQQQEVFAEERRLVAEEEREEVREDEKELHRRETQKHQHHRRKERSKESEKTTVSWHEASVTVITTFILEIIPVVFVFMIYLWHLYVYKNNGSTSVFACLFLCPVTFHLWLNPANCFIHH